jgi:hypothetical protein
LKNVYFLSSDEASYERSSYSSAITNERKRSRVNRRAEEGPNERRGNERRGKEELQGHKRSPVAKRKKKRNTKNARAWQSEDMGQWRKSPDVGKEKGKKKRAKRRERLPLSQSKQEN